VNLFRKNQEHKEDSLLLQEYLESGDLEILGALFNRYIHLVYGVCLKYLKDREQSKDAVNQIFEKLIIEIPKFKIQNFRSWLYVVTKNHCLMEIRKNQSEKKQFEKFSADFYMESTSISHPIDEERDSKLEKKLQECIEKLKKEQQKCVQLFYYGQKCYREIANHMGIDEKKVKSYIQNGKRNLKICIEEQTKRDEI
jgi:RNA polymerase sigma-70 factor (ECF subfamily)